MAKHTDIELNINGVIHFADVLIDGTGEVTITNTVKDNGVDNCDPCLLTDEIIGAVKKLYKEEIAELKEQFDYEVRSQGSVRARNYALNG